MKISLAVRACSTTLRMEVLGLALKPRWVHPLNFREQDKAILDASVLIARREGSDLTNVIRDALREYTTAKLQGESQKLDVFMRDLEVTSLKKLLIPEELKVWPDSDVLDLAKLVRSRKQELEFELRKRGYFFPW